MFIVGQEKALEILLDSNSITVDLTSGCSNTTEEPLILTANRDPGVFVGGIMSDMLHCETNAAPLSTVCANIGCGWPFGWRRSSRVEKKMEPAPKRVKCTTLYDACKSGDMIAVTQLLDRGADMDRALDNGATPLHLACQKGHVEIVQCLLERGADKDKATIQGAAPLHIACQSGHVTLVRLLLDSGAHQDEAAKSGDTPLHSACGRGHLEVVRLLLEKGADKDKAANNGASPLHSACQKGHEKVARLLIDAGANKVLL